MFDVLFSFSKAVLEIRVGSGKKPTKTVFGKDLFPEPYKADELLRSHAAPS